MFFRAVFPRHLSPINFIIGMIRTVSIFCKLYVYRNTEIRELKIVIKLRISGRKNKIFPDPTTSSVQKPKFLSPPDYLSPVPHKLITLSIAEFDKFAL